MSRFLFTAPFLVAAVALTAPLAAEQVQFSLRRQMETSPGAGRYHQRLEQTSWDPAETAVIVCDVWDLHHSINAVRRVEELGPRLNAFVSQGRRLGMTIIHSPSDCMDAYDGHPARRRAMQTPRASRLPAEIQSWCSRIPQEEAAVYPLDQSDGGDDDDPAEHAQWAAKLKQMGRNPGTPWKKQSDLIVIDPQRDYISDRGDEVWNTLEQRGIKNVMLVGVHTNMCVLGRPFGLRQMVRNGKRVVLVRDLTDTMYNPEMWPYVSHFTGTDRIVDHIERFVCPTITSNQLLDGSPFRFQADKRPHLAIVMAEDEYQTSRTLTKFSNDNLGRDFRVTLIYASDKNRNQIPGLEALETADAALFSVRRRTLVPERLAIVRKLVAAGKPVLGIRTASHAFSLRGSKPDDGLADWPEFDGEVFGGNYTNHYGNKLASTVQMAPAAADHPLTRGLPRQPFPQGGSLYKTAPLATGATVLLTGEVEGQPPEPVAWTFKRRDGGDSFYTSLGHVDDFQTTPFQRLLLNAIYQLAGIAEQYNPESPSPASHWSLVSVPDPQGADAPVFAKNPPGAARWWYRCSVRLTSDWVKQDDVVLQLPAEVSVGDVWLNGHPLKPSGAKQRRFAVERDWIDFDDVNLLVVRMMSDRARPHWPSPPSVEAASRSFDLAGRWQARQSPDPGLANIPLPARYGTSTDIVFEP